MSIEMDEETKRATVHRKSHSGSGHHSREDDRKRVVPKVRSAGFRDRDLDSPNHLRDGERPEGQN
jgi:hypothetical protein